MLEGKENKFLKGKKRTNEGVKGGPLSDVDANFIRGLPTGSNKEKKGGSSDGKERLIF